MHNKLWLLTTTALCGLVSFAAQADAPAVNTLPQGGAVVAGSAGISTSGNTMNVNQSSNAAVINWNSFDVGSQAKVTFNQPSASSRTLNRVLSSDPSRIYGQVTANGQLYFVNPNGVIVGQGARIEAGAITATTMDIGNDAFMAGANSFSRGAATGEIVNEGTLAAAPKGYVALIGAKVSNKGTISAPQGQVAMAAGDKVTLPVTGSGLIGIEVDAASVQAAVSNEGTITAPDGQVYIKAEAASSLGAQIVNKGTITAKNVAMQSASGSVFTDKGSTVTANKIQITAGTVTGLGTIQAVGDVSQINIQAGYLSYAGAISADNATGQGGTIDIAVKEAAMFSSAAKLTANGRSGGTVKIVSNSGYVLLSTQLQAMGSAGAGGTVTIGGKTSVALLGGKIDVSGTSKGGTINIGGGWQGIGSLLRPDSLTIDAASTLKADATISGNGGEITLWSKTNTDFYGTASAKGGPTAGNGGRIELSSEGKLYLKTQQASVNVLALKYGYQSSSHGWRRKRGAQKNAIGCSRGGRNTKVHMIADPHGRPRVLCLTGGNTHDSVPAKAMFALVAPTVRVLADAAYDSAPLRNWLAEKNVKAIIPNRSNRKEPFPFDAATYKRRNVVERSFCRLKDFRRFATRYDRLAETFMATACIVAVTAFWLK